MQFRTIHYIDTKERDKCSCIYITTLPVLFHCSFPTQLFNSNVLGNHVQSKQVATIRQFSRQIDIVKACSFFTFVPVFRSSCSSRISVFYSLVYFFIALPQGSVCRFIFFSKFNCTDPGLQLGDSVPLIGLLLWTC